METETIEYMEQDIVVPRLEDILLPLLNELQNDQQIEQRLDAIAKLDIIADGFGIEKTRAVLIPYLTGKRIVNRYY
jgi:hypothetical protein